MEDKSKWLCTLCDDTDKESHCVLEINEDLNGPKECPFGYGRAGWFEVSENPV